MAHAASQSPPSPARPPAWLADLGLGFVYWLAFLLLLEPGNVIRAIDVGQSLAWNQEAVRIGGAAVLGASVTPLLLGMVRRFPLEPGLFWRRAALQALTAAVVAAGLILLSCVLAAWFLPGETRPLTTAIRQEMTNNWPLLVYCIGAFVAAAHAVRFLRRPRPEAPPAWLTHVIATARGKATVVRLDAVDWIETQGNYLALHAGAAVHLVRDTLVGFEARLDPQRFVRIHRRALVAVDRVLEITPLDGGDAALVLTDGRELRVSRNHRQALKARLAA